jgi:PiT family inorganic phosphate transporter
VGAVIGIGILKGGKEVQWDIAGKISIGWLLLPVIAALISFIILFVLQNIFNQTVYF